MIIQTDYLIWLCLQDINLPHACTCVFFTFRVDPEDTLYSGRVPSDAVTYEPSTICFCPAELGEACVTQPAFSRYLYTSFIAIDAHLCSVNSYPEWLHHQHIITSIWVVFFGQNQKGALTTFQKSVIVNRHYPFDSKSKMLLLILFRWLINRLEC